MFFVKSCLYIKQLSFNYACLIRTVFREKKCRFFPPGGKRPAAKGPVEGRPAHDIHLPGEKKDPIDGKTFVIFFHVFSQAANNNISVPVSTSVKLDMHCEWTKRKRRGSLLCQVFQYFSRNLWGGGKGLFGGIGLEIRCARLEEGGA